MPSSALTSDNSAIVMIDHTAGLGNVFRSHDISGLLTEGWRN
jgi:hypothetical protein